METNKLKVLYFALSFGDVSFIQTQIEDVSTKLDIYVLCCNVISSPYSEYLLKNNKLKIITIAEPSWLFSFRQRLENADILFNYYNPIFSRGIARYVQNLNPDIIHCQFGYDAVLFFQNYYNIKYRYVITFRGFDASLKLILRTYRAQLKSFLSKPNVFPLFVANSLRLNLSNHQIKFNEKSRILYSNIDTEFYVRKSYDYSRETIIFTQVSNFREKKGHYFTVKAFEGLQQIAPDINFQLNFVGHIDEDCERIISQVKSSPVYSKIVFTGRKSTHELRDLLERSHYFIHHSITSRFNDQEGIPNSIMEAMAMELPVVTTQHSGIPELDNGEVDIFFSEERNIDQYLNCILKALKFKGYSNKNRERIVANFNKSRFVTDLVNFYKEIV